MTKHNADVFLKKKKRKRIPIRKKTTRNFLYILWKCSFIYHLFKINSDFAQINIRICIIFTKFL